MEMKGKGPGWGQAIIIRTPLGKTYLYDTGSNYPDAGFDAGKDMIAPFLEENKIKEIDGILISHSHNDHFGGFNYLMNNYKINNLWDSGYSETSDLEYDEIYKPNFIQKGGQYSTVCKGTKLHWDENLEIEVLSPPKDYLYEDSLNFSDPVDHHNPNLNSLVLRIKYKDCVFLFTGDLNEYGQKYLIDNYDFEKSKISVLALGHGGAFSFFAEKLNPEIVVSSCLNGVEGPALEAQSVYSKVGSKVYATCWNGIVCIECDGKNCSVNVERADYE